MNGIESPIGSAQYDLSAGDRIWWDYRDWTAAMRVPAVVGSWPEPFVHGFQGKRYGGDFVCMSSDEHMRYRAKPRSRAAGATGRLGACPAKIRVVIGPWQAVRKDPLARWLLGGAERSGVFASLRRRSKAPARPAKRAGSARRKRSARAAGWLQLCDPMGTNRRPGW